MVKAVTFDFWNTLFRDTMEIGAKRHSWRVEQMAIGLAKADWQGEHADIYAAIREVDAHSTGVRLQGTVDYKPEEQLENIMRVLGIEGLHEHLFAEIYAAYTGAAGLFPPNLLPGASEVVREMSGKYPIALISNTGITPGSVMREIMAGAGILEYFTVLTFSNEVNLVKPNPQIFEVTAQSLGIDVTEIVHTGDDFSADVMGAHNVGARGVWLHANKESRPPEAFAVISEWKEFPHVIAAIKS